ALWRPTRTGASSGRACCASRRAGRRAERPPRRPPTPPRRGSSPSSCGSPVLLLRLVAAAAHRGREVLPGGGGGVLSHQVVGVDQEHLQHVRWQHLLGGEHPAYLHVWVLHQSLGALVASDLALGDLPAARSPVLAVHARRGHLGRLESRVGGAPAAAPGHGRYQPRLASSPTRSRRAMTASSMVAPASARAA